ncbi:hypothetical protein BJ165DRAFT_1616573 [Panaeolus papilionaceus]|nr:hypothetical protein BJ165DRAFT_1616573 [Panaeolus papilionaceus]
MATQIPVLPVDIFGHIIDLIANEPWLVNVPLPKKYLKRLSRVNKTFAGFCQRHLFNSVYGIGFHGRGEKRFKRLLCVIKRSPHICSYVRDLKIDILEYEQSALTKTAIMCARTRLANFSNLQILDISRHKFEGVFQPVKISNPIISLLLHLANTYISQQTLRSLTIDDIPYVSMTQFLAGPFAERLRFSRNNLFTLDGKYPVSRITKLLVIDTPIFDLSVLMCLPELERLTLHTLKPILPNASIPGCPSFNLVEFSVLFPHPGAAALVVNLFKDRAEAAGVPAFGELIEVEYDFRDFNDLVAFNRILEDEPPIDCISLFASDYSKPIFPINLIRFNTYFQTSSRPMTYLAIDQRGIHPDAYILSLAGVIETLSSIATHNSLTNFNLYFTTEMIDLSFPPSKPWRDIGDVLAPIHNFPKLENVEFTITFRTDAESLRIIEEVKDEDGFGDFILDEMEDLEDRLQYPIEAVVDFEAV